MSWWNSAATANNVLNRRLRLHSLGATKCIRVSISQLLLGEIMETLSPKLPSLHEHVA